MSRRSKFWFVALILLGAALRFHGLFFNSFSTDEALFASWARLIAVWQDPLLVGQIVDKPPLLFYLQAIFYPLIGAQEWAARLPNFIGSILLIPTTGLLGWRLFAEEYTAIVAAAFVALSPLAIQFSGTAYTDPLLTFLLTMSLLLVVNWRSDRGGAFTSGGRSFIAGLLFGLATAIKYQAWLFLPLVIGIALISGWQRREWRNWVSGLFVIVLMVVGWNLMRTGDISLLSEQMNSYGGLRLAWSWELWPRLEAWGQLWIYLLGSPILSFTLLLAPIVLFIFPRTEVGSHSAIDRLLSAFLLGYFALHWLLAIPIWDRYILPVIPILGLVLGRFLYLVVNFILTLVASPKRYSETARRVAWLAPLLLIMILARPLYDAYQGQLPVGGNPRADHGASQLASALEDATYGSVLYDHWYSWQWRYHLFDKKVYVSWFPGPNALLDDLAVFANRQNPNYLVLPDSSESIPLRRILSEAGFSLKIISQSKQEQEGPTMTLYQIESN